MKLNDSQKIMSYINESYKENNLNEEASHKMNSIKYETNGYTKLTDGMYKGKPIVDYREKDFKKGTTVLTPMICENCGKEFYVKSNIHDFFEQGDFDDPYEVPKETIYCPKCKEYEDVNYNGEVLIKESVDTKKEKLHEESARLSKNDKEQVYNLFMELAKTIESKYKVNDIVSKLNISNLKSKKYINNNYYNLYIHNYSIVPFLNCYLDIGFEYDDEYNKFKVRACLSNPDSTSMWTDVMKGKTLVAGKFVDGQITYYKDRD